MIGQMKLCLTILFTVLFLKISAETYAIAKYFENTSECKPGTEGIWAAIVLDKCSIQQGNLSFQNYSNFQLLNAQKQNYKCLDVKIQTALTVLWKTQEN
jgi:hypothetical protein